jgi:hypothetical protein
MLLTLLRKPSHTNALYELIFLLKNVLLQGNSVLYTCMLWKLFKKYFSTLFPLFFQFSCVKRPDGVFGTSGRWSCMSGRYFWLSGRYSWFVRTFILLVWTSLFLWPLRGITSERHLSSVRTVNPVGLNCILPGAARHFLLSFCVFCHLVRFPCVFYAYFSRERVLFGFYLLPRYVFILFY